MKPPLRNLSPRIALAWNQNNNEERFTKKEFLENANPNIWDIEEWNRDGRNEKIIIT